MSGRLLLLRHAQTTAPPGVYLGSGTDVPLSLQGREQAVTAGCILAGRPLAAVVVSPLLRARQTAALAVPDMPLRTDERLRELDFGAFGGLTFAQVEERFPAAAAAWRRDGWPSPPGGEHPNALWRRVLAAGLDLAAECSGDDVLVVAHGGPIRALLGAARGLPLAQAWRVCTPHAGLRVLRPSAHLLSRWRTALADAA